MKILLDENVANKIKEGLIDLGFKDTIHINDKAKGVTDKEVLELAQREKRIIITGDDDFKADGFKYQNPVIWITPKARLEKDVCEKIDWILNNITNYHINIERAFVTLSKDMYVIEYKNKDGVFGKIKKVQIKFDSIKIWKKRVKNN